MQPDHSFRPFYVALACLTLFLSGSCWSLGVFTVPVEQHAHPRGVLNGIWPAAMGIGDIIFTPLMILSEMFLDGGRPKPRDVNVPLLSLSTVRIRIISLVVCFVYAVFGISAIGTQRSNSQLIMVPVALRSIASILCK